MVPTNRYSIYSVLRVFRLSRNIVFFFGSVGCSARLNRTDMHVVAHRSLVTPERTNLVHLGPLNPVNPQWLNVPAFHTNRCDTIEFDIKLARHKVIIVHIITATTIQTQVF